MYFGTDTQITSGRLIVYVSKPRKVRGFLRIIDGREIAVKFTLSIIGRVQGLPSTSGDNSEQCSSLPICEANVKRDFERREHKAHESERKFTESSKKSTYGT